MFLHHLARGPSADIRVKIYGDLLRGTPPSGEFNTSGVAEYSDFGPDGTHTVEDTVTIVNPTSNERMYTMVVAASPVSDLSTVFIYRR